MKHFRSLLSLLVLALVYQYILSTGVVNRIVHVLVACATVALPVPAVVNSVLKNKARPLIFGIGFAAGMLMMHVRSLWYTLAYLVVISVVNGFKAFREAYILCGDYPHESIYMLQHYINNNFQNLNYQKLAVGTIVIFLMILAMVLLIFLGKWRKEGGK